MGSFAPSSECYVLPKPGDVLVGKYSIERVLGSGGMATVFLATHVQLGGRVAIKCPAPQIAEKPEFVARFLEEARAAVGLRGEHSVRVFDVGVLESGLPYIVMEYLRGCDLSEELERNGPLPIVDAVDYVLQACEALAEAHRIGIVHRDLKPGNLFLSAGPDGVRRIKVLDFGVSKRLSNAVEPEISQGLTAPSTVLGSPQYMAPEQVRSARTVDARADIWSVGVVLFELVTDTCPFQGSTLAAIGATIVADEPLSPRSFRPDLSESLEKIILRCLRKDPDRRFQDVLELATELAPLASPSGVAVLERIARISVSPTGHNSPGAIKIPRRPILLPASDSQPPTKVLAETFASHAPGSDAGSSAKDAVPTLAAQTLLSPVPEEPVTSSRAPESHKAKSWILPGIGMIAALVLIGSAIWRGAANELEPPQPAASVTVPQIVEPELGRAPATERDASAATVAPIAPLPVESAAPPKVTTTAKVRVPEPPARKKPPATAASATAAAEPTAKASVVEPESVRSFAPALNASDPLEDRK